jgi:hypothetical protein
MIELIISRNTADNGFMAIAKCGAYMPISTPMTIDIMIHDVREMRRTFRKIGIVEALDR